jgi:hypothetical protein
MHCVLPLVEPSTPSKPTWPASRLCKGSLADEHSETKTFCIKDRLFNLSIIVLNNLALFSLSFSPGDFRAYPIILTPFFFVLEFFELVVVLDDVLQDIVYKLTVSKDVGTEHFYVTLVFVI